MKGHQAQSTETDPASRTVGPHSSNVANVMDPRVLPQPEKMKQHTTAGPHQSDTLNRMDRKVDSDPASEANQHHYGRDAAVAGGLGAGAAGAYAASQHHQEKSPYTSHATTSTTQPTSQHHYGRDAALAGGVGAGGLGAYEYQKREAEKAERTHPYGSTASATGPVHDQARSSTDPSRDPANADQKHHYGRDAAVAGTAGAAGAGAAHEFSKHDAEKAEKERIKEQKEHEKEAMKQQKELDKEQQKDNKKYQKELEKDEKKHEKELEKEEKKHEKMLEKEEKKHEKEEKKKHGGGLFGFLHRDKNKEGDRSSLSSSSSDDDEKRHRREAGAVAAGGAGAAAYEHEDGKHERHRLHKDPPAEYVKAHGGEHYGTDGRIGEAGAVSGTHQTRPGEYGAVRPGDQEGIVIEPHTGLPMNVGKYGSGAGGTDGNETIEGFSSHGAGGAHASGPNVASQGSAHGGNIGPDWQDIKKANTPY
ncbi:putative cell surface [Diplodia seriata]|uniref:Putative cell surface n=1 Tax=Diplodia seriata TaxID=420778 RepID=A0A0G2GUL5_9PEZI|nr:putative cell surface [Diplodia seriata]